MAKAIIMPRQGQSVESCILTKWYKQVGDTVKIGDLLFTYETDKATFDEEAKEEGTLLALFYEEGDDVPCLDNVCAVGNAGEDVSALAPGGRVVSSVVAETKKAQPEPVMEEIKPIEEIKADVQTIAQPTLSENQEFKISPRARNLAEKVGLDAKFAVPTGPYGRIIAKDIETMMDSGVKVTAAASSLVQGEAEGTGLGGRVLTFDAQPQETSPTPMAPIIPTTPITPSVATEEKVAVAGGQEVKLSNIRKVIAKSMMKSITTTAQLTLNTSFDVSDMLAMRKKFKESGASFGMENVTLNDMLLYAVSRILPYYKELNAHLLDDKMVLYKDVHLGLAVDTDRGLMVPTIMNANQKSLHQISSDVKTLAMACQKGSIDPDTLKDASFTVTNLGVLGIESFTPVLNPPQTGILGVCSIVKRVREENGQIKVYPAMGLSLTFDHRALDGAPAARFLKDLTSNLENFSLFLAK